MKEGIYLDNAATTWPKPEWVYRAVERFAREVGGNPGRGGHRRSLEAGRELLRCREALARLLEVKDPSRIIFTHNATEALNIALSGLISPGSHVLITSLEHNSVWRPVHRLCRERDAAYDIVSCERDGRLDPERVAASIKPETRLMVATHASNVLGTLLPLADLAFLAHRAGALILVDAAQTVGRFPLRPEEEGLDLVAFSGHKELYGPTGTGALCLREGLELPPLMVGGTGSDSLSPEQPHFLPDRLESGTSNVWGITGLRAGVEFVLEQGIKNIRQHEEDLYLYLRESILDMPGISLYGPVEWDKRVGVVSFNVEGIPSGEVASYLDEHHGIAVRSGLHCSPLAHRTAGTVEKGGTVRVGFSLFNRKEDIDALVEALKRFLKENR